MNQVDALRLDCAKRQKKGLHFILASVIIWVAITVTHLTNLPIETKNIVTFCCAAPLLPLAWAISRMLHIDFEGKGNPLTQLGVIFSVNQILYILIAMWVFSAVPEKMLMVGLMAEPYVLAAMMVGVEAGFSMSLVIENRNIK